VNGEMAALLNLRERDFSAPDVAPAELARLLDLLGRRDPLAQGREGSAACDGRWRRKRR
jgi:hypothetical protein